MNLDQLITEIKANPVKWNGVPVKIGNTRLLVEAEYDETMNGERIGLCVTLQVCA